MAYIATLEYHISANLGYSRRGMGRGSVDVVSGVAVSGKNLDG